MVSSSIDSQCDNTNVVRLHVEDKFANEVISDISLHPSKNSFSRDVQLNPIAFNDIFVILVTERSKAKMKLK
jgi:hypothetical protein